MSKTAEKPAVEDKKGALAEASQKYNTFLDDLNKAR